MSESCVSGVGCWQLTVAAGPSADEIYTWPVDVHQHQGLRIQILACGCMLRSMTRPRYSAMDHGRASDGIVYMDTASPYMGLYKTCFF